MAEKFAVYIPGQGFSSVESTSGAAEIVWLELSKYRALDQWPDDIESLGIYSIATPGEGGGLSEAEISARIAAGARGGYVPLALVREIEGARITRRPCESCDPGGSSHCVDCEGVGYLDAEGEPWPHGDAAFRTDYEFEISPELLDSSDDGLGFPRGCANAAAIMGAVGVLLAIYFSDLLLQWWQ